jgi:hypothetical protein
MKVNTGLAVRKTAIAFIIIVVSWQLLTAVRPGMNFFPVFRIFSVELFLTHRFDPVEMMETTSKEIIRDVQDVWKKHHFEVLFVREEAKMITADSLPQHPSVAIFFKDATLNGREIKEPVRFSFSKQLVSFIKKRAKAEGAADESFHAMQTWKRMLAEAGRFSADDYEKLRSEFPEINYSFEEIRQLRLSGVALIMINSFVHVLKDECRFDGFGKSTHSFKESSNMLNNQSLLAYPLYFYEQRYLYCWAEALRQKGFFVLAVLLLAFLLTHLFQKDAGILLGEEMRKRNLEMNWKYRLYPGSGYWKLLISVAKKRKREMIAEKICEGYAGYLEEKQSRRIIKNAERIWLGLMREIGGESLSKRKDLQTLYQNCIGNRKNGNKAIASRLNDLKVLRAVLEKAIICKAENRRRDNFAPSCLGRSEMCKAKNRSSGKGASRNAVATGVKGKSIITQFLEETDKPALAKAKKRKVKFLPETLKVIIIGGNRIYRRKQELIEAVMELGPKRVEFREVKGVSQVKAAARTDPENTLLVLAHVPHGNGRIIYNKEGLRWIFIDPVSRERFKDEVIKGYYGLQ